MNSSQESSDTAAGTAGAVDMKLEVVVIPVSDVIAPSGSTPAWDGGSMPTSPLPTGA